MKIATVTFYSRRHNLTKKALAKLKPPTIIARNWYALNNNQTLAYVVEVSGRLTDFNSFDTVKIGAESFAIFSRASVGEHKATFEVVS